MKAQVGIEYLIIFGFVTFAVIGVLALAVLYSNSISDSLAFSQLDSFANKIISTSESLFYTGEPSKLTITAYLPKGIEGIVIANNEILFTIRTSSGENKMSFSSKVPISGSLSSTSGLKKIQIQIESNRAIISQV